MNPNDLLTSLAALSESLDGLSVQGDASLMPALKNGLNETSTYIKQTMTVSRPGGQERMLRSITEGLTAFNKALYCIKDINASQERSLQLVKTSVMKPHPDDLDSHQGTLCLLRACHDAE